LAGPFLVAPRKGGILMANRAARPKNFLDVLPVRLPARAARQIRALAAADERLPCTLARQLLLSAPARRSRAGARRGRRAAAGGCARRPADGDQRLVGYPPALGSAVGPGRLPAAAQRAGRLEAHEGGIHAEHVHGNDRERHGLSVRKDQAHRAVGIRRDSDRPLPVSNPTPIRSSGPTTWKVGGQYTRPAGVRAAAGAVIARRC